MSTPDEIRNVAILGHKGAGKTALVEAALFVAKVTPKLGKPGDRTSGLDDSPEERTHLTTLEARPVTLSWSGRKVHLVDTPGEASFVADARLALAACDAAIICVSARDGVQTGTERALQWVRERKVPCLVVVTKMDDEHARPEEVIGDVKAHLKTPITMMEVPDGVGPSFHGVIAVRTGKAWIGKPEAPHSTASIPVPPESEPLVREARAHLVDDVAGTDDALTEKYLNDGDLSQEELDSGARHAVADCKLIPVFEASCTMPSGIVALLDGVVDLLPSPAARLPFQGETNGDVRTADAGGPLAALVFKTHIDPHSGKVSYVRVLSGTLQQDAAVTVNHNGHRDRIGALSQGTWKETKPIPAAIAGEICAVAKLKTAKTGDTLSDEKKPFVVKLAPPPPALYARTLLVEGTAGKGAEEKAAQALQRICEEDPGLVFKHDAVSREMLLEGLGALHLDITVERLRRRASIDCRLGPPRIPYRETVRGRATGVEGKQKKQTGGHGQFGVCYIDLEPMPRGAGFVFEDAVVGGSIPRQFIPSVEKGVRRAMERGVLAGYPLVDVRVRVVDGKHHSVDSSDAAFQVAGGRALRAAMQQAHPVLLEPIARLEVTAPSAYLGEVIGDVNARGGRVTGTDNVGPDSVVQALLPLANTLDYEPKLTSLTSGRGTFMLGFDHYDYCSPHTTDKVVRESGFKHVEEED
ncbi:MAG TPA: elongation factor G [Polyangiaceae bacterium]|jgi:elongation factor G